MLDLYKGFIENYGVITIEDPYEQDDWDNWKAIVAECGEKCQIVGDDHLVTNPTRIKKAIEEKSSNALLLKVRLGCWGCDGGIAVAVKLWFAFVGLLLCDCARLHVQTCRHVQEP